LAAGLLQANGTEPVRTPVLQNNTVAITHLRFAPGTREATHTNPFPIVLVQITPGEIEVKEQDAARRGNRAREVWFEPKDRPHSIAPRGSGTIDLLAIGILPTRPAAPSAPATDAPPGITRATLVDNTDVRVVRVRFDPNGREPAHTHPNDLVTV